MKEKAADLEYELADKFEGYPHIDKVKDKNLSNIAISVVADYLEPFNSLWNYDESTGFYKRTRNNKPEIDKDNNMQVEASVIVLMETKSAFLRDQYINVNVQGEGVVKVYQGGVSITGKWKKDPTKLDSKLFFYDSKDEEIKFLAGRIWVQIVPNRL